MSFPMTYNHDELRFHPSLYRKWRERANRWLRWTRIEANGLDKIASEGPALIAPNHLSWKDILLIVGMMPRPVKFAANFRLFNLEECKAMFSEYLSKIDVNPLLQQALQPINQMLSHFLVRRVRSSGAIPAKLHSTDYSFMDSIIRAFQRRKLVCIFPEGRDSPPGELGRFKLGIPIVLLEYYSRYRESIPVYPIGIWGTHRTYMPGMKLGFHVGDPLYIKDHLQEKKNRTLISFAHELRIAVEDCMDQIIF